MKEEVYVTFIAGLEDGPAFVAASDSETFFNKEEAEKFVKTWFLENPHAGYYTPAPMITTKRYSLGEPISPDEFK